MPNIAETVSCTNDPQIEAARQQGFIEGFLTMMAVVLLFIVISNHFDR